MGALGAAAIYGVGAHLVVSGNISPGTLVALRGVAGWQMYFFDLSSSAWRNAQSSGDLQDGATPPPPAGGEGQRPTGSARESMPDGARLLLTFAPGVADADGAGSVTRDVRLLHP